MLREPVDDKQLVDLHVHTLHSDGTLSVQEVFEAAVLKGVAALSITDHDCIDAYPKAFELGRECGIEVIPGVELSSEIDGIDIHVLGYCFDIRDPVFNASLARMRQARYERAVKIVGNLNSQGVDLRFETVLKIAGDAAIGRPHIATAMLKEELIYSFREAFDKYIGYNSPAYVEKLRMHPREIFELITSAGGIAVLAHPGATKVDERIPEFIRDGVEGIEVFHPEHTASLERYYKKICRKYGLVMTGGSDFHAGEHPRAEIGSVRAPLSIVPALREYCAHRGANRQAGAHGNPPPAAATGA